MAKIVCLPCPRLISVGRKAKSNVLQSILGPCGIVDSSSIIDSRFRRRSKVEMPSKPDAGRGGNGLLQDRRSSRLKTKG